MGRLRSENGMNMVWHHYPCVQVIAFAVKMAKGICNQFTDIVSF